MNKLVIAAAVAWGATALLPAQAQIPVPGPYYGGPVYAAPPPRYEPIPNPRPGYHWRPGHWNPHGSRHVWIAGTWVVQPGYQPGYVEPGYRGSWEERRRYRHGHRDSDGDGVPNRYDRRPDNPYRY